MNATGPMPSICAMVGASHATALWTTSSPDASRIKVMRR
jgi:hypothetical protein